jgi:3-hydroxyisobutyrate dehydrogenase
MGAGMAGRLLHAGHQVTVWNRSRDRAEPFAEQGARVAATPREAAARADVIIAMVADDDASREIWLGDEGAFTSARAGTVIIESSTLTPSWIRELAAAAKERGYEFIDAPVTGSRVQAASGELLFLVGGEAATLDKVRDVLNAMGRGIVHLGPVGSGALVKLVNNFVCGVQVAALAEALALIERSGLERERALGILLDGAPGSPLVKAVSQRMINRDYTVFFRLGLMAKDLTYARGEGEQHGVALDTAGAALQAFERARAAGHGALDIGAVIEPLRS